MLTAGVSNHLHEESGWQMIEDEDDDEDEMGPKKDFRP